VLEPEAGYIAQSRLVVGVLDGFSWTSWTYLLKECNVFATGIRVAIRFEPDGSSRIAQDGSENIWSKKVGHTAEGP
jgi:hypothetical protein